MTKWGQRHTLVVICFFMGALNYSLRFNLSMGIVAMVSHPPPPPKENIEFNSTLSTSTSSAYHQTEMCPSLAGSNPQYYSNSCLSYSPLDDDKPKEEATNNALTFNWNEKDQGLILGSFYWGYVVSQFPSGLLAQKYGGKWIIALSMLSAGLLSYVLPYAAILGGRNAVIGVRILQGFSEGFVIPALVNVKAKWFPPEERARLNAVVAAGFPFGTSLTMLVSGQVIPVFGWPAVFYIPGVLTILLFLIWIVHVHSSPHCHPKISPEELKYITSSIENGSRAHDDKNVEEQQEEPEEDQVHQKKEVSLREVPWKAIACSLPVLSIFMSQCANAWGHNMLKEFGPKYLHSALHFDIHENSYVAASPHLLQMIFGLIFARLSDYLLERKVISMLTARKLCNSIGQWGVALAFAGIIISGCNRVPAVICYVMYGLVGGAILSGSYVNALDISPKYAGVIEGFINSVAHLTGFAAPYLAGVILHHEPSISGWRYVFMVPVITNFVGNLIFLIWAEAKVQWWNDKASKKMGVDAEELDL